MQVLISSPPMEGVFGPCVPLGRALLDAGHRVVVATGPDLAERAGEHGFDVVVAGPTALEGAMTAMGDPAVTAASEDHDREFPAAMFAGVIAPAKLPALFELTGRFRPDLVVHPVVDVAAPVLAAALRVPSVAYGFGQVLDPAVVDAIARRAAPLWRGQGLEPEPFAGIYRGRYLDPCPPGLRGDRGAAERVAVPMRPLVPGDPNAELPAWAKELGPRRVVYVSLGTVPLFNQPATFKLLLAELADSDVDLVVTVGELNDPGVLGVESPTVHVERWLPLAPLLPRCDAVLCHAGSGTTLAALACGLPLVLVPQGADQFANATACQRAGCARVLDLADLTPTTVRRAVETVVGGSEHRAAAERLAAEIAGMPAPSEVARDLEALVAD